MTDEILRFARYTLAFQRMAATELRLLANRLPEQAHPLTDLADRLDEHADDAKALASRT